MVGYYGVVDPYRTAGASLFHCFAQYSETREEFPKSPDVSGLSIVDMRYPYSAVHFALIEFGQQRRREVGAVPVTWPGGCLCQYSPPRLQTGYNS